MPCHYADISQSPVVAQPSPTPAACTYVAAPSFEWGPITAELMHHWTVSTSQTFSDDPVLQTFMQVNAARVAFANEHVLHMILAISALHLTRLKPNQKQMYSEHAERHYEAGLRTVIPLLPKLNEENCHSIFLFASLCNSHSLARGPKPGDFLLFGENGPAEWSILFKGMLPVVMSHASTLMDGPLAPMMRSGAAATHHTPVSLPIRENEQFSRLHELVQSTAESTEQLCILEAAMDHLRSLYSTRYTLDGRKCKTSLQHVGIWLWRCIDGLTVLCQDRHPAALVIFAFACVALNDSSDMWSINGLVPHLLTGIHKHLSAQYHVWIQWPIQQVGWVLP